MLREAAEKALRELSRDSGFYGRLDRIEGPEKALRDYIQELRATVEDQALQIRLNREQAHAQVFLATNKDRDEMLWRIRTKALMNKLEREWVLEYTEDFAREMLGKYT